MATTILRRIDALALRWIAIGLGVFHLLNVGGVLVMSTMEIRIVHLGAILVLLFATTAALPVREGKTSEAVRLIDLVTRYTMALVAIAASVYLMLRWEPIAYSGGMTTRLDAWVGLALCLLVLEGARRRVGFALAMITVAFFVYPFVSPYLPGQLYGRGYGLERISIFLATTTEGIYGIPLGVSATYIVMFTIFGAFLDEFGAGEFFFQVSSRLTRRMRAASAKTAVAFSALIGMISGSAAANVAVTGTLTIPMMKREGYAAHQAGAIQAVVATGGQIMPPVMGAAAFIMAEIIGRPYSDIMTAALIPALLFFLSILIIVHLQAVKLGIVTKPMEETEPRPLGIVLFNGIPFIVPFLLLVGLMVWGYSPFKASFAALGVLLVLCAVMHRPHPKVFVKKALDAIEKGVVGVVPIAVACAAAGIISGVLAVTGLGSKISALIIAASVGIPLLALVLTMIVSVILGMGLPTTAAYLILATVVAPALVKMGVPVLTAHMFVFFYGCISTITPPVALASYVAAGIAGSDINKVSWTAFWYGLTSYVLPFMFFFGPPLMMEGTVPEIVVTAASGVISVFCFAAGIVGWLRHPLGIPGRLAMLAAGLLLLYETISTDLVGLAILGAMWFAMGRFGKKEAIAG
ncbi:TRAP-type putative transport system, fused permease component [Rhodovulum sp. PH10]|uniref:TRAP transporter permease n=1 Tax=Rhodovulum sp. PH10 TaxID=1187851 RepID=UPI00027C2643|nr:TRAP transporter fused permease subunit [Rhodovulum sp. PH10]EJW12118.1 TRAP-type putative transport system, fused permease component [Rhodovulum sp. PH10]